MSNRYNGPGDYSGGTRPSDKVRAVKRAEAAARAVDVPWWVRKRHRRAWTITCGAWDRHEDLVPTMDGTRLELLGLRWPPPGRPVLVVL